MVIKLSTFKKYKDRMIVTTVAIILIVIIGVTSSERLSLTKAEKIIGNIFSPIEKFFYKIGKKVSGFFVSIKDIANLKEENEKLKTRVVELEEKNRPSIACSVYSSFNAEQVRPCKWVMAKTFFCIVV